MQNKAIFYFHFDIFIFENKVAGDKMQLNWQYALCPAAMECPGPDLSWHGLYTLFTYLKSKYNCLHNIIIVIYLKKTQKT